jgi:hypothetical protein
MLAIPRDRKEFLREMCGEWRPNLRKSAILLRESI